MFTAPSSPCTHIICSASAVEVLQLSRPQVHTSKYQTKLHPCVQDSNRAMCIMRGLIVRNLMILLKFWKFKGAQSPLKLTRFSAASRLLSDTSCCDSLNVSSELQLIISNAHRAAIHMIVCIIYGIYFIHEYWFVFSAPGGNSYLSPVVQGCI